MEHRELNHLALHVKDVAKSCEFYERVLDLQPIPRPAFDFPGAWYQLGTAQELHLIGERVEPVHAEPRGNHFALMIDDMDAWEAHLRAARRTVCGHAAGCLRAWLHLSAAHGVNEFQSGHDSLLPMIEKYGLIQPLEGEGSVSMGEMNTTRSSEMESFITDLKDPVI